VTALSCGMAFFALIVMPVTHGYDACLAGGADDVAVYELFEVDLPDGWDSHPSPESLRELGQQWLEDKSYAVLIVPSAITQESNFLINPIHPDFSKISVKEHEFKVDARLTSSFPSP